MAYLFKIEGKILLPNAETLLISPYKDIWNRDKSKSKEFAIEDFTYMEFMTSLKRSNPYRQYHENHKHDVIVKTIITRKKWKVDKLIKEGMEILVNFQKEASTTYNYYMSAKIAAENMQKFFRAVDLMKKNTKTGNPIYKPKEITSALIDTEKVLTNLNNLEKKVEEELFEETKTKSGKEISFFAKRNSIV